MVPAYGDDGVRDPYIAPRRTLASCVCRQPQEAPPERPPEQRRARARAALAGAGRAGWALRAGRPPAAPGGRFGARCPPRPARRRPGP